MKDSGSQLNGLGKVELDPTSPKCGSSEAHSTNRRKITMNSNKIHAARYPTLWFRQFLLTTIFSVSALVATMALVGCADTNALPEIPAEAYAPKPGGNLEVGDEIAIAFSDLPELTTRQKIQTNGMLSLPTVGDVDAAGQTVKSLQTSLAALYQPHMPDSTVSVSLEKSAAFVYVSGLVSNPGKVQVERQMTALEAVMEAGGFTELGNPKNVTVVRTVAGNSERYVLNLNNAIKGAENTPFYIKPYDVIFVKERVW